MNHQIFNNSVNSISNTIHNLLLSDNFYCNVEYLTFSEFKNKYNGTNKRIKIFTNANANSNLDICLTNINDLIYLSNDNSLNTESKNIFESLNDLDMIYCMDPIPFVYSEINLIIEGNKILNHSHTNTNIDSEFILDEEIVKNTLKILDKENYKNKLYIQLGLISNHEQQWKILDISFI